MTEHMILKFIAMDSVRALTFLLLTPCILVNCARPHLRPSKLNVKATCLYRQIYFQLTAQYTVFMLPHILAKSRSHLQGASVLENI